MGMSGDFEQAIAMCVVWVLIIGANAGRGLYQPLHMHRNSRNSAFTNLMHVAFRGATNVRLGSTIFGAR